MFQFKGELEASKSWMNRALILQSFQPSIKIDGQSQSRDVLYLQKALQQLQLNLQLKGKLNDKVNHHYQMGLGGTTFRFFALRVSREMGTFHLHAEPALFARPQSDLVRILEQLSVKSYFKSDTEFVIESHGWQKKLLNHGQELFVPTQTSSQFLSAVLLNAIDLPFDLKIQTDEKIISENYFNYTIKMMKELSFQYDDQMIFAHQKLNSKNLFSELDVSSAFSLIAAGVLSGEVTITNWNQNSQQPDMAFLDIFKLMDITFESSFKKFHICTQKKINALKINLNNCPDLFPVLAVLCAFADGESHLYGAEHLAFKESHRIKKTIELLSRAGFHVVELDDGLRVKGQPEYIYKKKDLIFFDPEHDHRMAFAAALLQLKKFPVIISHPNVIDKSYPQFYQHIGLSDLNERVLI